LLTTTPLKGDDLVTQLDLRILTDFLPAHLRSTPSNPFLTFRSYSRPTSTRRVNNLQAFTGAKRTSPHRTKF
ncbi:hypothetical protein LTS18_005135, partial [Coniosporium uncinatum]